MRLLRVSALLFAFVCATSAFARASDAAPADEYFGPYKQSILEVRNRLMRFESEPSRQLAREWRGMSVLAVTIDDWYRHYPRDPWIAAFRQRLARLLARARHR